MCRPGYRRTERAGLRFCSSPSSVATRSDVLPCPQSSEDPELGAPGPRVDESCLRRRSLGRLQLSHVFGLLGPSRRPLLGEASGRWKKPRRLGRRDAHAATRCLRSVRTVIEARSTVGCRARDPRGATAYDGLGAVTAGARKDASTTGIGSEIAVAAGDSSALAWGITLPRSPRRVPESSPPPPNSPPWSPFRIWAGNPRFTMSVRSLPIRTKHPDCAASAAHAFAPAYGEASSVACHCAPLLASTRDGDST